MVAAPQRRMYCFADRFLPAQAKNFTKTQTVYTGKHHCHFPFGADNLAHKLLHLLNRVWIRRLALFPNLVICRGQGWFRCSDTSGLLPSNTLKITLRISDSAVGQTLSKVFENILSIIAGES